VIVAGIILLVIAWALPQLLPDVPPGVVNVCDGIGWLLVVFGLILLIWGLVFGGTRPIGGRRWYY
jgi:hypothetical protein